MSKPTVADVCKLSNGVNWITTETLIERFAITRREAQTIIGTARKSPSYDVEAEYDNSENVSRVRYRIRQVSYRPPTDVPAKKWRHAFGLMNKSAH